VRVWVWESMRKTRELLLFEIPVRWGEVRGRSVEGGTDFEVCGNWKDCDSMGFGGILILMRGITCLQSTIIELRSIFAHKVFSIQSKEITVS